MFSQAYAAHADKEVIVRNNPNNIPVFALRALLTQQLQLIQHRSLSYPELKQLWKSEGHSDNLAFKTHFSPNFYSFKSPEIPFTNKQELNE